MEPSITKKLSSELGCLCQKTCVSHTLQAKGISAIDADDIEGLSAWYNKNWQKVPAPKSADKTFRNHYSFL
jgi:hypothetical protein